MAIYQKQGFWLVSSYVFKMIPIALLGVVGHHETSKTFQNEQCVLLIGAVCTFHLPPVFSVDTGVSCQMHIIYK